MQKKSSQLSKFNLDGLVIATDSFYFKLQGFFERAQEIATYYGFKPILLPEIYHEHILSQSLKEHYDYEQKKILTFKKNSHSLISNFSHFSHLLSHFSGEIALMKKQETFLYYSFAPHIEYDKKSNTFMHDWHFNLSAIGNAKPVTEALLLQVTQIILREHGISDFSIDIYTEGDIESQETYEKELRGYFRRHVPKMSNDDKELYKTSITKIIESRDPKLTQIINEAPDSINFLTNPSKKHFKKIVELVEQLEIPYTIDRNTKKFVGQYHEETIYRFKHTVPTDSVKFPTEEITLAQGGYSLSLPKKMGYSAGIASANISISLTSLFRSETFKGINPKIMKDPNIFFVKVGESAELQSIPIIEILRKHKIPVYHSLSEDSLSVQIETAKSLNIPYMIIFGKREELDKTVILRDMKKGSQDTVKIEKLHEYIKKNL